MNIQYLIGTVVFILFVSWIIGGTIHDEIESGKHTKHQSTEDGWYHIGSCHHCGKEYKGMSEDNCSHCGAPRK